MAFVKFQMAAFNEKVYALVLKIPYGKVTTYKAIAEALGTKAYRAVGNALNKNKNLDTIKCCKAVKADGTLGGFASGSGDKIRRLKEEGIKVVNGKIKDFELKLYKF